jgi:hypothetical protein
MADRVTIVPPRDPWPFSTVTADDLEALVAEGLLRPLSDERQPEWMPPRAEPPRSGCQHADVEWVRQCVRVNESRNTLICTGPVTVGRIPHGLPGAMRTWD